MGFSVLKVTSGLTAPLTSPVAVDLSALTTLTQGGGVVTGLIADGDSISAGTSTAGWPAWPGIFKSITGLDVVNRASFGQTLANRVSTFSTNVTPYVDASHKDVTINAGINDLIGGATAAQISTLIRQYCAAVRSAGAKVTVLNLLPAKDGENTWDATKEGYRQTYNADLAANWASFADAFVDVAALVSNASDRLQLSDGLHPTGVIKRAMADLVRARFSLPYKASAFDGKLDTTPTSGSGTFANDDLTMTTTSGPAIALATRPISKNTYFEVCFDYRNTPGNPIAGLAVPSAVNPGFDGTPTSIVAFNNQLIASGGAVIKSAGSNAGQVGIAVRYVSASEGYVWFTFDGATYYGAAGASKTKAEVESFSGGIPMASMMALGTVYPAVGCVDGPGHMVTADFGAADYLFSAPAGYAKL